MASRKKIAWYDLYGMFGRYIPGLFLHRGYIWDKNTCGTNSIYGSTVSL